MEEMRNATENFWKLPHRISRHRWENNIKMDLTEVGCEGVKWIQFTQDNVWWQTFVNFIFHTIRKLLTS
jgi:hypothetical protein